MEREMADHIGYGNWEVVPIYIVSRGHKPILAVWSMKQKCDPCGDIVKWKAWLCAHGGLQTTGINY